jgi:hypothetical protein
MLNGALRAPLPPANPIPPPICIKLPPVEINYISKENIREKSQFEEKVANK